MGLFDKFKKKKQASNDMEQSARVSIQGFSWKDIKNVFFSSSNNIKIYEKADAAIFNTVYKTPMEALVHSVLYIEVNDYLRILGTGDSKYNNVFAFTKYYNEVFEDEHYIIAHDVFGGLFASAGTIWYLAPDTLEWVDLGVNYQNFIRWAATPGVNDFYKDFLWEDAEKMLSKCSVDEGILIYPFLWSKECSDMDKAEKKIVPFSEIMETTKENMDLLSKK